MDFDFRLRVSGASQSSGIRRLQWQEIRAYHNSVFRDNGLPTIAWTAEIPLRIVDQTNAPGLSVVSKSGADTRAAILWENFLRDGWIIAGLEALTSIFKATAHKAGWDLTQAQRERLAAMPGAPAVLSYNPTFTSMMMTAMMPGASTLQAGILTMKSISSMTFSWRNSSQLYCERAVDIMSCARHLSEEERLAVFWLNCIMTVGVTNAPSEFENVLRSLYTVQGQYDTIRTLRDLMFNHQFFRTNPLQWLMSGSR